jgi:hypothetical protein
MESVYQIVTIHVNETSWAHVWRLHSRYLRTGYDIGAGLGPPRLYRLWRPSLLPPHVEEGGDLDPSRKREGDWEERRGSRGERERDKGAYGHYTKTGNISRSKTDEFTI